MLLIKRRFFEDIRRGRKTTTLRYWRSMRVQAGSVHTVPGLGRIRIDRILPIHPENISEQDAREDGFASAAELHKALADLYPRDKRHDRRLYKIHFTLLE